MEGYPPTRFHYMVVPGLHLFYLIYVCKRQDVGLRCSAGGEEMAWARAVSCGHRSQPRADDRPSAYLAELGDNVRELIAGKQIRPLPRSVSAHVLPMM
jgi:hypothetical protein